LKNNYKEEILQKEKEKNDLKLKLCKLNGELELLKSECRHLMEKLENYRNQVQRRNTPSQSKSWTDLILEWAPMIAQFGLSYSAGRAAASGSFRALK